MTGYRIKPLDQIKDRKRVPIAPTEFSEQKELVKWIRLQPRLRDCLVKLNNEGKRSNVQGYQLKQLGMVSGASDLFLAYPVTAGRQFDPLVWHGLWIELKRRRKYSPSERRTDTWVAQEQFHEKMRLRGYACVFAYGWEDAKDKILEYVDGKAGQWHIG